MILSSDKNFNQIIFSSIQDQKNYYIYWLSIVFIDSRFTNSF